MTLRQVLQTPGVYRRMVKPWKPDGGEPIEFEMVRGSADRTIVDVLKTHRRSACPASRPPADRAAMDMELMKSGPAA